LKSIPNKARAANTANNFANLFEENQNNLKEKITQIFYLNIIKKIQKAFLNYYKKKNSKIDFEKQKTAVESVFADHDLVNNLLFIFIVNFYY